MSYLDYDDYDPSDDTPPKEEPDCPPCGDTGHKPAGWLLRLSGRTRVGCPDCNPGQLARLLHRAGVWRLRHALRQLTHPRPAGPFDDEAPF